MLKDWKETDRLGLLNLKYDAMPADFVSVVGEAVMWYSNSCQSDSGS